MNQKEFGKKLKELRDRKSESQAELGELLKVGIKQIQRYENGEVLPTHENLALLCNHYQYDFISLIYNIDRGNKPMEGIEIKTASGKIITVVPEGKSEIELLNAFLQERDRIISEKEDRKKDAEIRAEKAEKDNEKLYQALADNQATINGILSTVVANLGDIKEDTSLGLAYQRTWVEYTAEQSAQGDKKKKLGVQVRLNNILKSQISGVGKGDRKTGAGKTDKA